MLESMKQLHKYAKRYGPMEDHTVQTFISTIEREIDELYIDRDKAIEAPLDADGIPWNLTEKEFIDPQGKSKRLQKIIFNTASESWQLFSSDSYLSAASECRHVKPDPVKELLGRMADELYADSHETPFDRDFIVEKYVDELRDLLYGDAE